MQHVSTINRRPHVDSSTTKYAMLIYNFTFKTLKHIISAINMDMWVLWAV